MVSAAPMQLGMVGLGRMGANLVRRLMRDGHRCVAYDVNPAAVGAMESEGANRAGHFVKMVHNGVEYGMMAAIAEGVPAPVITTALYERFQSRQLGEFSDRVLSAMRSEFGGHVEKK